MNPTDTEALKALVAELKKAARLGIVDYSRETAILLSRVYPALERLLASQGAEPGASSKCPICGIDTPHNHGPDPVAWYASGGFTRGTVIHWGKFRPSLKDPDGNETMSGWHPLYANAGIVPGWVMVPRKRTPEMGNACIAAIDFWQVYPRGNPPGTGPSTLADRIWEAMLAAAPDKGRGE